MPAPSSQDRRAEVLSRLSDGRTRLSEPVAASLITLGENPTKVVVEWTAKPHAWRLAEAVGRAAGRAAAQERVKAQLADSSYFGLSLAEALEALRRVAESPLSVQDRRDVADRAARFIEDCAVDLERLANGAELLAKITGVQGDRALAEQPPIVEARKQYAVQRRPRYAGAPWLAERLLRQTERSGFVAGVRAGLQKELAGAGEALRDASTTLRRITHDAHPALSGQSPDSRGDVWKSSAHEASRLLEQLEPLVGKKSPTHAVAGAESKVQPARDALTGLATLAATHHAVREVPTSLIAARQPAKPAAVAR